MWVVPETLVPALLLQILVVGYTPGPANIYALTMAIRHGRRKALRMWAGLATGASVAVCVVAVLTHFLGEALGDYVVYLKYFGAAYLVYLAFKVWKSSASSDKDDDCTFLSGMLMLRRGCQAFRLYFVGSNLYMWSPLLCLYGSFL